MESQKVSALKLQKKNPNRVNVYLDGEFAFGLAKILAVGLRIGQELSKEKIAELQAKDSYEEAMQKAYRYLSYRPRSESEIRSYLAKKEIPGNTISAVMDKLKEFNYANDKNFAELWINNRSEFRPRGKHALRMELRQKGISEQTINSSLEQLEEEPLALELARKKAKRYLNLPFREFKQKMYGLLARRGFDYDTISHAISVVWEEIKPSNENEEEENYGHLD